MIACPWLAQGRDDTESTARRRKSTSGNATNSSSLSRPHRLALLGERPQTFLGVLGHCQNRDLALQIRNALVERHRADRAHRVFAAADRGWRFVGVVVVLFVVLCVVFVCL